VIGVGFARQQGDVTRFLVDLQYTESILSPDYTQIARIDHNPANPTGHDVHSEGIHVDARRKHGQGRTYYPTYSHIPNDLGEVIKASADYLSRHADFFVDFYDGSLNPANAPRWTP
jgi:hypothetical protein